jgi:hypothetical protein
LSHTYWIKLLLFIMNRRASKLCCRWNMSNKRVHHMCLSVGILKWTCNVFWLGFNRYAYSCGC